MSTYELGPEFLSRLRDAIDIIEVISDHVRLKHKGRSWEGLCPFHEEKTPSFSVDPVKGLYYCFGCHQGGDAFKFLMELEHLSFPEVVEHMARRFGVPLPERDPNAQRKRKESERQRALLEEAQAFFVGALSRADAEAARRELKRRSFEESSWKEYGFGWAPDSWRELLEYLRRRHPEGIILDAGLAIRPESNKEPYDRFRKRLMFPIRASDGRIIAFGGRIIGEGEPKYLNSPEGQLFHKRSTLFHLHKARKAIASEGRVLVVEGYFDCLSLHHAGIGESVATLGTALTGDHARVLRRLLGEDGIALLCYDADKAGKRAARNGAETLLQHGVDVRIIRLREGADPDDIIREDGINAFRKAMEASVPILDFLLEDLPEDPASRRKEGLGLAPLVCQASNPASRQNLIDELARRLNLRPRDIEKRGRETGRQNPPYPSPENPNASSSPIPPGEIEIVRLLLNGSEEIRARVLDEIKEETLMDHRVREIFRLAHSGISELIPALMQDGVDPSIQALAAQINLGQPDQASDESGQKTLDLIIRRQRRTAAERLQKAIEEAVQAEDFELLADLQKQKIRLREK